MEFQDEEKERIQTELNRWKGLRHLDRRADHDKGIDCIHLVFEALFAGRILQRRKLPAYNPRWGFTSHENLMAKAMDATMQVDRLPGAIPQYGDIVIFPAGAQSNHCGLVAYRGRDSERLAVWHVMKGSIVHPAPLDRTIKAAQELVRFHKRGWKEGVESIDLTEL